MKFKDNKIISLSKNKEDYAIVMKGINYIEATESADEFKNLSIHTIEPFKKNDLKYKMIKAICVTKEVRNKLINEGILVGYMRFKVESYLRPVKPIQCYNCQSFGHFSSK